MAHLQPADAYDISGISTLRQYLAEAAAHQLAADLELQYDAHGPRATETVRRLDAPQPVDRATWEPGGLLDAWIFNKRDREWIGRVRHVDGTISWLRSAELRIHKTPSG
ncbi:MAG TPA: hypothetical protein VFG33_15035 [Kribbella sp.]|uniref:hypothetical protein n=1 Tax=Kribbella sp. TaxID=1871183 RepID=UPI002D76F0B9|nr:hypothetical protein [Kribbella sp.]HET6294696.1 hypothetical protein [Kribbella sp.]